MPVQVNLDFILFTNSIHIKLFCMKIIRKHYYDIKIITIELSCQKKTANYQIGCK